jgi:hypothetical protein
MTISITDVRKVGDDRVVVVIRIDDGVEPRQREYTFNLDDEITLDTIKAQIKPEVEALITANAKFDKIKTALINKEISL